MLNQKIKNTFSSNGSHEQFAISVHINTKRSSKEENCFVDSIPFQEFIIKIINFVILAKNLAQLYNRGHPFIETKLEMRIIFG
jgi:hypothetical protein